MGSHIVEVLCGGEVFSKSSSVILELPAVVLVKSGELEEKQIGDLLDVVAVTDSRVLEDVSVVPDFRDDGGGRVGHVK
jgi:hypothetical protein